MAKLGDRVLYRALEAHHTTVEEHVHDVVDGKRVPRFTEIEEQGFTPDGDKKILHTNPNGSPKMVAKKVPVMATTHVGSVHHEDMRELVGMVGRVRTIARTKERDAYTGYDILLLVPNRAPEWVDGVEEGPSAGQFTVREDAEDQALKTAAE